MPTVDERKAEIEKQVTTATEFLCAQSASWSPGATKVMVRAVIYALACSGWEMRAKAKEPSGG